MQVCGALSSGPGRNTNMKPPLRASSHWTSRTLVTRASTTRPRTSKRIVSPTSICEPLVDALLDRHLGSGASPASAGCPVQNAPSITFSFGLEVVAIGDHVLAAERAAAADVLERVEVDRRGRGRRSRARAAPESARRLRRRLRASRNAAHGVDLILLDVDQEHVRRRRAAARARTAAAGCDCSERTPRTKKLPRPTASRMTRVWLPGPREAR